ncbi:MAG: metal ABC transporter ATP-binding protein [Corynebacterium sp.]|uniref:metal ABC transporter ATP-binding protein n=1 Tax=Corynebacterium sp. TaxID=1720 RepID=UPI0026E03D5A|nr:metal ABC transporter ATP-binding protein [Corynebacterium sp.]MDO5669115.1 metal ABC transporter ATP-binding protein [Corynebacterium sp.]
MSGNLAVGRGLQLGYERTVAVAPSDVTIPLGKLTAIIGPNGSGKSTLLHAIGGLTQPQAGELEVAFPRERISYVMQSVAFPEGVPLSVREVVRMGRYPSSGWLGRFRGVDKQKVDEVMARLNVSDLAKRHLEELSGGQRQRVYVAQGMAQDHDVLLLDEPLTGLDIVSARIIDEIIHDETDRGSTVVLTTHDLAEANAADHVVLMSGRVVASGPPEKVLTESNLRQAYNLGELHDDGGLFIDSPHEEC